MEVHKRVKAAYEDVASVTVSYDVLGQMLKIGG